MKMADEEGGNEQLAGIDANWAVGSEANPKKPGWYPSRTNPSDQTYWDGQQWTGRRRWTAGKGWLVSGDGPLDDPHDSTPRPPRPRFSANPYVGAVPSKSKGTGFTFNLGVLLLLIC